MSGWPQQPDDDLRIDTAWRENYSGASMNRKLHGTLNVGIYEGFKVSPGTSPGLNVVVGTVGEKNVAVIEVFDEFSLTARMPKECTKTLDVEAGKLQYVVLDVFYAKQQESTVKLLIKEITDVEHVILATLDIPADATFVTAEMISMSEIVKPASKSDVGKLNAKVENIEQQLSEINIDDYLKKSDLRGAKFNELTQASDAIALESLNIITATHEQTLIAAEDGAWFDVEVASIVDLDAGDVRFLPPANEEINALGKKHDDYVRIVKKEHTFKFYRLNGEWHAS